MLKIDISLFPILVSSLCALLTYKAIRETSQALISNKAEAFYIDAFRKIVLPENSTN